MAPSYDSPACCATAARRCVEDIAANADRLRSTVENSICVVTVLSPYIGYANATVVALEAHATGGSGYEIVLRKRLLSKEQLGRICGPIR